MATSIRQKNWNRAARVAKAAGGDLKAVGVYCGKCDGCGVDLSELWTVAVPSAFHPSYPNVFCVECAKRRD